MKTLAALPVMPASLRRRSPASRLGQLLAALLLVAALAGCIQTQEGLEIRATLRGLSDDLYFPYEGLKPVDGVFETWMRDWPHGSEWCDEGCPPSEAYGGGPTGGSITHGSDDWGWQTLGASSTSAWLRWEDYFCDEDEDYVTPCLFEAAWQGVCTGEDEEDGGSTSCDPIHPDLDGEPMPEEVTIEVEWTRLERRVDHKGHVVD